MAQLIAVTLLGEKDNRLVESTCYINPEHVFSIERATQAFGQTGIILNVSKVLLVCAPVSSTFIAKEMPDILNTKVEKAMAERRTMYYMQAPNG